MVSRLPARKVTLDWSRLLGFDQVTVSRETTEGTATKLTDPRLAMLGGKVGTKGCIIRAAKD